VGGRGHGKAATEEWRPLGRQLSSAARWRSDTAASRLLFFAYPRPIRLRERRAAQFRNLQDATALGHSRRLRNIGWRGRLAVDLSGTSRAGYAVSDSYPRLLTTPSGIEDPSAVYPADLQLHAFRAADAADEDVASVLHATGLPRRYETAARTDRAYERIARELTAVHPTQISLVRYQSLDSIGHHFLRYATPSEFGDVTDDERRRLGSVLERHYGLVDDVVGRAIASLGADDLLLVVSGYGMEPMGFVKRLLERLFGDPDLSGTHEAAPDGFLMAYGGPVVRGRSSTRASIVDIVPTVLYFLGLPIGRDMDGQARTDLFRPSLTEERPVTYIRTYGR
jgi:hypothetical protein